MAHQIEKKALKAAPQISPIMQGLSAYIARALRRPLPPAVLEKTKHHLLDTLAAMLSGSRLPPGKKAISFAKTLGGTKEACVVGSRIVTAAANAALANGMLGHADETDDSHSRSQTHPGCGVVAAALATAERERAGGTALLRAVALGYDVCCRLTQSLNAVQFRAAGHSTHSFGPTFGAAAAAGALAGMDERGARHLLSYAAQQASGISCWMRDEEHIEKDFDFGGMPARNGVAHLGANTTDNRAMPDICMQHLCAVMLADGSVSFKSSHDGKRMRERMILELRGRVELVGDDALTQAMPRREGIVEIRLKDGREFRHHTRAVRGTPENPMSREEVEAKSHDLMAPVTGIARSRKLCETVWNLESIKDVRTLRPLLRT